MKKKVYIISSSTISTVTNKLKQWETYFPNNVIIKDQEETIRKYIEEIRILNELIKSVKCMVRVRE